MEGDTRQRDVFPSGGLDSLAVYVPPIKEAKKQSTLKTVRVVLLIHIHDFTDISLQQREARLTGKKGSKTRMLIYSMLS